MSAGSLIAIINPLVAVSTFFSMTTGNTEEERLRMSRTACITATGVLMFFALTGNILFRFFGITIAAFQMAGGLLLLLVSLNNLQAKGSAVQVTDGEKNEGAAKSDVSITPLAIPMLAGPGAITTAILLASRAENIFYYIVLMLLFVVIGAVCYLIFYIAILKASDVKPIVMNITTRLMGLVLCATAVQFIIDGIRKAFLK